jgi:DNA-binding NarL/FixJ family response regulator
VQVISVLVVDDNLYFLREEVELLSADFRVVGTAQSGASVLQAVADLKPDVIVLDLSLGDMSGFEVARRLRASGSTAKIVMLTVHEGREFVQAAVELGILGYVYKSQAEHDLPRAITEVYRGNTYYPPGTVPN